MRQGKALRAEWEALRADGAAARPWESASRGRQRLTQLKLHDSRRAPCRTSGIPMYAFDACRRRQINASPLRAGRLSIGVPATPPKPALTSLRATRAIQTTESAYWRRA